MRVLFVNSSGYPEGGVESHLLRAKAVLTERGHEVRVLTSDLRPDVAHFSDYEFAAIDGQGYKKYVQRVWNASSARCMKRALRDFDPHIVHLHTMGQVSPSVLGPLADRPVVATVHGPETYTRKLLLYVLPNTDFRSPDYSWRQLTATGFARYAYLRMFSYPVFRYLLRRVDAIVSLSTYMQSLLASENLTSRYLPIGVDPLPRLPLDTASRTLVFAGRLEKVKGVSHLIEAMSVLVRDEPQARLLLAGEGVERENLVAQVRHLGIEGAVTFLGHLTKPELTQVYARASLAVFPSTWPEPFGLAGVEAMSTGRPVVATAVGGVTDWLDDGVNGLLVPPSSPDAIAVAVRRLWALGDDLHSFSDAARATADRFSESNYCDRIEALYTELAAARS